MKVLVVGSGGREHALAWKLSQSPQLEALHCAPGNPGMASLGNCHPVRADDAEGLLALAGALETDLVVVGPEAPLVAGLADHLRRAGIAVFGPGGDAARIEGSKTFAKEVMAAAGVRATPTLPIARPPCVIKADGLAAGKGAFVCRTKEEVDNAIARASELGESLVIEELVDAQEVSIFALCDGREVVPLPAAQDYKRVGDGDTGPNTGGMGCYSPFPGVSERVGELVEAIHRPVVTELARRGTPFVGALYAGVFLTDDGPLVFEFNCRFGDPETQVILPRIDGDLLPALAAAAGGALTGVSLAESDDAAVTVAMAAGSYPERGDAGAPIDGVEEAESAGTVVFHAGTALREGRLVTNGGRILNVTGLGNSIAEARDKAYAGVERIHFEGCRYRTDIALGVAEGAHVG
ncbi:MAG: phosphoribosylamine--glycine ligase [Actinobacteria bacterium]|nr:phosphoribosylamine--glycine ligase [Actinomycetota bacterium]